MVPTSLVRLAGPLLSVLFTLSACAEPVEEIRPSLSELEPWVPLFDGTSFTGWRGVDEPDVPEAHWVIEAGTIRKVATEDVPTGADGQSRAGRDIMTVDAYRSFELIFDWKVAPGSNSGVTYNVSPEMSAATEPTTAALGFEYQVLDDALHPDAQNGANRQAAALYDVIGPGVTKALRPVGEFNEAHIIFDNGHGEHWLNGVKVVEYDVGSERFNQLLAGSKYNAIDGFAGARAGHIVLQAHDGEVWFRNIQLRVIER